MTKVINLIGGPGVGKSTVATGLFSEMKQRKISCEYVSEYAKEVTWEETFKLLENQIHVFSEQFRRQFRLINKVSYIITDSPLILNSIYFNYYLQKLTKEEIKQGFKFQDYYINLVEQFFDESFMAFDNMTYLLTRVKDYDTKGRNQTLEESKTIDVDIKQKLNQGNIKYQTLTGTEKENINSILKDII